MKCVLAAAISLLALSLPASAAQITGELSLTGTDNLDTANHTITFTSGNALTSLEESGDFTALGSGGPVIFRNEGSPIIYPTGLTSGSNLNCGSGCLYQVIGLNGLVSTFDVTNATATTLNGFVDISGTGTITLTGFTPTPGTLELTAQGGVLKNVTFSSTVEAVPGPIVGAGLPGLFSAACGIWALARRRRRHA